VVRRILVTAGCMVLLVLSGCGQTAVADRATARPAASPTAVATPVPTPTPTPTPVPPTPTPAPAPAIALAFGPGSVTVSVTGIANGAHQVHVHRDCTGNPNLHITTLGDVFVNPDGAGARTFSLAPSLRNRGFDLLVYPPGATQGTPSLCAGI
jgi:hypothetical protein